MSAKREKKIRQEMAAQGIKDPKLVREAEEKAKQRRSNILYASIAVIFVVVAAILLVFNSGIFEKKSTALTVDGENYSPVIVSYYYSSAYQQIVSSSYSSYYGLDTSVALDKQNLSDTAKLLLGVSNDMTWADYFKDQAINSIKEVSAMKKAAEAEGYAFTDEMQQSVDTSMENLETTATAYGYTLDSYLKAAYGKYMTASTMRSILKDIVYVGSFESDYQSSLTYSVSEMEAYYKENADSFDTAAFDYIIFNGEASSTTDADGNTVDPTEEETAVALQAAQDAKDAALTRYESGESLEAIAGDYDCATYSSIASGSHSNTTVSNWAFDTARVEGDHAILEDGSYYYLIVFNSRSRNEYDTVNVRHILISADTSDLDSESETYEADVAAANEEAKAKAEKILADWKAGAATEDYFAELANANSSDTGSNTTGGLYSQVFKGQMVTAFNDWCFDESRKAGDTGIVETTYGYHVMYFVGYDDPYWQVQVSTSMANEDYTEWADSIVGNVVVTEGSGMKYVIG